MRTVIDIDKELLEVAQRELGTGSMKETVNAALQVVADDPRMRAYPTLVAELRSWLDDEQATYLDKG